MKYDIFKKLPLSQQCVLMNHLAVEVSNTKDLNYQYFLYQLDAFYIEIKLHLYLEKMEFVSFTEMSYLERYITDIDISEIV